MPKSVRSFDRITIPAPCDADWDSMIGNDQVRFCEHCNLHVNNLSAMTRSEVMRLVERSRGRLCVRYVQRVDGEIVTRELPKQLYRISRRASRIAAGAFSATLSLTSAAAQSQSTARSINLQKDQTIASVVPALNEGAKISGIVKDPNGAVVPHATVSLSNSKAQLSFVYVTDDDGAYNFAGLEPGSYALTVEAAGFAKAEIAQLDLSIGAEKAINIDLTIPAITAEVEIKSQVVTEVATMGVVSIREPVAPLPKAAYKNDLEAVAELVRTTSDIDTFDEFTDQNALDYAVQNHNLDMIHVLLSAGAGINSANKFGRTPLMHLNGDTTPEMLRDLFSAGANLNARDEEGETVLLSAARSCTEPILRALIEAGARIDDKDEHGNTLLMSAAQNSDPAVLRLMLTKGLAVDAENEDGQSALSIAAGEGSVQNVKVLIDAGATFNLKGTHLDALLLLAVRNEEPGIVRILLDNGAHANAKDGDNSALMLAAQYGKPETIKILVDAGADLNAVDDDGWTALMHADEAENALALLNAGVDPSIKNKDGLTALGMAIKYEQEELIKLFRSRGAPE